MLSHSVFDHSLVGPNYKRRLGNKQEQPNGFESLYRRRWQTAIQVVYKYDELFDLCLIEEVLELLSELINRFG